MKERNVIMLGGDLRQYYMAKSLAERDFAISYYGLFFPMELPQVHRCKDKAEVWEAIQQKDSILVLPIPVTSDGIHVRSNSFSDDKIQLEEILLHVKKGQRIFGGKTSEELQRRLLGKNIQIEDMTNNDNYVTKSMALVAEDAIIEAELLSDETIFGSRSLVLGMESYGRALLERLQAWGSKVTIASEFPTEAKVLSGSNDRFKTENTLPKQDEMRWDFVFRTTSKITLDAEHLNLLEPNTVIIDIADFPDGVDYDYAKKQGITACFCPAVAGKYAAKTAGEMLAEIVWRKMSE